MTQWLTHLNDPERVRLRLLNRISVCAETGHWLWGGSLDRSGYGKFYAEGKATGAHRAAWLAFRGDLPEPLVIDHLCRVRQCINPDHLDPVTIKVNVERGNPGRPPSSMTHCKRGHERSPENTYVWTNRRGYTSRICKPCRREAMRRFQTK